MFNILGPLTNPAGARAQVLGVADEPLVEKLALALRDLGCHHALVVHGEDNLDEITVSGKTRVCELKNGHIESYTISPEDFRIQKASADSLKGGSTQENAALLRSILAGAPGPKRDAVLMNSAAVLMAGDKVKTLKQGVSAAAAAIDSGNALAKLEQLIKFSHSLN